MFSPKWILLCFWFLAIFEPVLSDNWSAGQLIILVNQDLNDNNKVLEFNTAGDSDLSKNPHPVFMANDPGNTVLQNWNFWYVTVNTDNSFKIHNAYNTHALDYGSGNDFTTPLLKPDSLSTAQGFYITPVVDGTFTIYNHALNRYLGLLNGGWPFYQDVNSNRYIYWSFLPAVQTSTVLSTVTQTSISINAAVTSTVIGSSVTFTSTVYTTSTTTITLAVPAGTAAAAAKRAANAAPLPKRWQQSVSVSTSTFFTTVTTTVVGPVAYMTVPAGTSTIIYTLTVTTSSTTTSTLIASQSSSHPTQPPPPPSSATSTSTTSFGPTTNNGASSTAGDFAPAGAAPVTTTTPKSSSAALRRGFGTENAGFWRNWVMVMVIGMLCGFVSQW